MPYSLLIGLGAGFVSAVVFASATTGPMFSRLLLFLLTPLALFLAGLGAGPTIAVIAGIAGTAIVLGCRQRCRGRRVCREPGDPRHRARLPRLAQPHDRPTATEWYPAGRIVIAAALLAGAFSVLTLFLLGGDVDQLRTTLRGLLEQFVNNELPKMPDAPVLGPQEIDEATSVALALLPAASGISTMGSLLFNMWLAGRITLASGRLQRPWPDLAAISYPVGTPLLLAVATGAAFLAGHAGSDRLGLRGSAVLRLRAPGPRGRALHHARRAPGAPSRLWGLYLTALCREHAGLARASPFSGSPTPSGPFASRLPPSSAPPKS